MKDGNMIYVRNDDVLLESSGYNKEEADKRFKQIHRWICETNRLLHVPTILVTEIKSFPGAIEFIKSETEAQRMLPEIHGYEHINYGKLSIEEVKDHLKMCKEFIWEEFNHHATTWYTPWGASQSHLHEAANELNLSLVDCSQLNTLEGSNGVVAKLKRGLKPETFLEGKEIFMHWWSRGMRLKRVIEVLKHGSWKTAKDANGKWF